MQLVSFSLVGFSKVKAVSCSLVGFSKVKAVSCSLVGFSKVKAVSFSLVGFSKVKAVSLAGHVTCNLARSQHCFLYQSLPPASGHFNYFTFS